MHEELKRKEFHEAIDTSLSGLHADPWLAQRVVNRERSNKSMNKKLTFNTVLVIALIFLGVATALAAAGSYVIQYLQHEREINMEDVQKINKEVNSNGFLIDIVDAYTDDDILAVGMGLQYDEPAYLVVESVTIAGKEYDLEASTFEDMWINSPTEKNQDNSSHSVVHGFTASFDNVDRPVGVAEVKLRIKVLKPKKGICMIDTYSENAWAMIDQAFSDGMTPIEEEEPYQVLVEKNWFGSILDLDQGIQRPVNCSEAYLSGSNMEVLCEQEFSFDVDFSH